MEHKLRALGTVIEQAPTPDSPFEIYSGILDYYDHWETIDPRLEKHHGVLSLVSEVFASDIVNIATYTYEILRWLKPEMIQQSESVVIASAMSEGFIVSTRSACDTLAMALGYVGSPKHGQAPSNSLRRFMNWAEKNPHRLRPDIAEVLSSLELDWFWNLRSLRDHMVHGGASANIHTNSRQFNLWVFSPQSGWVTREPLLPFLKNTFLGLMYFADRVAIAVNNVIDLPVNRIKSRVIQGIFIPSLHRLIEVADLYSEPSP